MKTHMTGADRRVLVEIVAILFPAACGAENELGGRHIKLSLTVSNVPKC